MERQWVDDGHTIRTRQNINYFLAVTCVFDKWFS